jgi:hypothetical protein
MDATVKGAPVTAPKIESAEFSVVAYASKERHRAKALKTVTLDDGSTARKFVECNEVPVKMGITVDMVKPEKTSLSRFGSGWYTFLKCTPPDSQFSIALRAALQKSVQHVAVWDADLNEVIGMTVEEARKLGVPVGGTATRKVI